MNSVSGSASDPVRRAHRVGWAGLHERLGRLRARMGGESAGLLGLDWGRPAGWAAREWEREAAAGPDSVSSRVSAQYRIGIRKTLSFFKYFYNLQTNLNSIQI
jgi:hypothetical protein